MDYISEGTRKVLKKIETSKTSAEYVAFLATDYETRQFGDELKKLLVKKKISVKTLLDGIVRSHEGESINRETTSRNLNNWLSNRKRSNRDNLFQICLILELSLEDSKEFITKSAFEDWVHFNNALDLIFFYCLNTTKDIGDYIRLKKENDDVLDINKALEFDERPSGEIRLRNASCSEVGYSVLNQKEIENVGNDKSLREFLVTRKEKFVRTSFSRVKQLRRYLWAINPSYQFYKNGQREPKEMKASEQDERKRDREIGKEMFKDLTQTWKEDFALGTIFSKKETGVNGDEPKFTRLQKEIMEGWPDVTSLHKMIYGKLPVTRTTLILAYIGAWHAIEGEEENEYEEFRTKLNYELDVLGFPSIDYLRYFDAIIMKSVHDNDPDIGLFRNQVKSILDEIYK